MPGRLDRTALGKTFDVILIKNSLHLVPNLARQLRELRKVSLSHTKLVIVETVSPSVASRDFVRSLFRIIDRKKVKLHYFTQKGLFSLLGRAGWKREFFTVCNQTMSVDDWLSFKVDTELERSTVKQRILDAPGDIFDEMNIACHNRRLSMLRRQVIVFLGCGPTVVKGTFGAKSKSQADAAPKKHSTPVSA